MLGICIRYTKNREEAEDCLQESFIKIFTNLRSYNNEGSFEGWAKRITINGLISHLKKQKKFWKSFDIDTFKEHQLNNNSDSLGNLFHKDLLYMIEKLPDGKKIIFNLYIVEGYSHKEIADLLGIKEGTSKSQLARAKEMLAQLHKKYNSSTNVAS